MYIYIHIIYNIHIYIYAYIYNLGGKQSAHHPGHIDFFGAPSLPIRKIGSLGQQLNLRVAHNIPNIINLTL